MSLGHIGQPARSRYTCCLMAISLFALLAASTEAHPHLGGLSRPRLLLGPSDVMALHVRAETEPYRAYLDRYRELLEEGFPLPNSELDRGMMSRHLGALLAFHEGKREDIQRVRRQYLEHVRVWRTEIPAYSYEKTKRRPSLMISRRLQNLCMEFDLLAAVNAFTLAEEQRIQEVLGTVTARLMERGDSFNPYDYMSDRFRPDNWNSDRMAAVGMFALTFPTYPESEAWLRHATEEVIWQLEHTLLPSGAWPEGTRYQGAVLRAFVPFAAALRRNSETDLFQHPRFKDLLRTLADIRTPPIRTVGGASLTPGVGNANWESIWFAPLAWSAPAYTEHDPALAARLMHAWRAAGAPWVTEYSPGNPIAGFLLIDTSLPGKPYALKSTCTPGGWAVLRGPSEQPEAAYLLFNVGTPRRKHQHQHYDRGSFSYFAGGVPITLDPGVHDYDRTMHAWYMKSMAHNLVVFGERDHPAGGTITNHLFSDEIDIVAADLTRSVLQPYQRTLFYLKPDVIVVWDRIGGETAGTYHLHVLGDPAPGADEAVGANGRVSRMHFTCLEDQRLLWAAISPPFAHEHKLIDVTRDPHPVELHVEKDFVPTLVAESHPSWITLKQRETKQDFITLLHPHENGRSRLAIVDTRSGLNAEGEETFNLTFKRENRTFDLLLGSQTGDGVTLQGDAACRIVDTIGEEEILALLSVTSIQSTIWNVVHPEAKTVLLRKER